MRTLPLAFFLSLLSSGCYDERMASMDADIRSLRGSVDARISGLNTELGQLRQQNVELVEAMEQSADLQTRVAGLEVSRDEADGLHAELQAQLDGLARIAEQEQAILALQEELWRLEASQTRERNGSAQLAALGGLLAISPIIPLWSGRLRRRDA